MPAALPVVASVAGGLIASSGAKSAAKTNAQAQAEAMKGDPRKDAILFGANGSGGLLDQFQALGKQEQLGGLKSFGTGQDNYLGAFGGEDAQSMRNTAGHLMGSNIAAPQAGNTAIGAPAWAVGNMVDAPAQNDLNLRPAYEKFINGQPGANPYLQGAIQKGINQSSNTFGNFLSDAKSATQEVLGGIRGASVINGQYGGSRQGLAEGKAIESMNTQLGRAASQFGQNNTDAAVAAQAGAYDSDSNRALAATQGLGAQQYGVASQNAQTKNQAEFGNVNQVLDIRKTQAGMDQQINLANTGAQQNNNQLNSNNQFAGIGAGKGLLDMTYGAAQAQDGYALGKAKATGGLLEPYLNQNGRQPAQPVHSNTGAAGLNGAMAGLGLYNQFKGVGGTGAPTPGLYDTNYQPSKLPIDTGLFQNFNFMKSKG